MAHKKHDGILTALQVVVNEDFKAVKLVERRSFGTNRIFWVVRSGPYEQSTGLFTPYGEFSIKAEDELKILYPYVYVNDLSPFEGDILKGLDREGNEVVLLYVNDFMVYRLTKMNGSSGSQSVGRIQYYQSKLTDLKVMKHHGIPMSVIVSDPDH